MTLQRTNKQREAIAKSIAERIAAKVKERNRAFQETHPGHRKAMYRLDSGVLNKFTRHITSIVESKEGTNDSVKEKFMKSADLYAKCTARLLSTKLAHEDNQSRSWRLNLCESNNFYFCTALPELRNKGVLDKCQDSKVFLFHSAGCEWLTAEMNSLCLYEESMGLKATGVTLNISEVGGDKLADANSITESWQKEIKASIATN